VQLPLSEMQLKARTLSLRSNSNCVLRVNSLSCLRSAAGPSAAAAAAAAVLLAARPPGSPAAALAATALSCWFSALNCKAYNRAQ
jgi:hypothetical protein